MRLFAKYMAGIMLVAVPAMAQTTPTPGFETWVDGSVDGVDPGDNVTVNISATVPNYVEADMQNATIAFNVLDATKVGATAAPAPAPLITVKSNVWTKWGWSWSYDSAVVPSGQEDGDLRHEVGADYLDAEYKLTFTGTFAQAANSSTTYTGAAISGSTFKNPTAVFGGLTEGWAAPNAAGWTAQLDMQLQQHGLNDMAGAYDATLHFTLIGIAQDQ